jgi:hypothetical protein
MSVFTSKVTRTLNVPHDEGQTITIRKLAPRHLEAAAKEAQRTAMAEFRDMGGAAFMQELAALKSDKSEADAAPAVADPVGLFDRVTLLSKAVTAWSYEEAIDVDTLAELDEETQAWLAREVLTLAKPALFQSEADAETARKNG